MNGVVAISVPVFVANRVCSNKLIPISITIDSVYINIQLQINHFNNAFLLLISYHQIL